MLYYVSNSKVKIFITSRNYRTTMLSTNWWIMFNLSDPSNDFFGLTAQSDYDSSSSHHPHTLWITRYHNREGARVEQLKLQVTNTILYNSKYTRNVYPKIGLLLNLVVPGLQSFTSCLWLQKQTLDLDSEKIAVARI